MNRKEIAEIRRRIRPNRNAITHYYGCYVNGAKEIISYIDESVALLTQEENEKYLGLLKKALSGTAGKNLIDISFATKQVMDSEEHRLLSSLRKTELKDAELRDTFYKYIIDALDMDGDNYLILMACDTYDIPQYHKDGQKDENVSGDVYKYIICSICPVKQGRDALGYRPEEHRFSTVSEGNVAAAPELGFLFPAFDDRTANIYSALFYSKNTKEIHQEFIDAVFRVEPPMSPAHQKDAFGAVLSEALQEDCSYNVVKAVNEQLGECIMQHKESKDPETLTLSIDDMESVLENCGMEDEQLESFRSKCEEEFGSNAELNPANIINSRRMEINIPGVKISVEPQFSHLVQAKIIGGRKFILISADSGVELNGINVNIDE